MIKKGQHIKKTNGNINGKVFHEGLRLEIWKLKDAIGELDDLEEIEEKLEEIDDLLKYLCDDVDDFSGFLENLQESVEYMKMVVKDTNVNGGNSG